MSIPERGNPQRNNPHTAQGVVIQRTVDSDVDEGWNAIDTAVNYQQQVHNRVQPYTNTIMELNDVGDTKYEGYAERMAAGFKAWGENYYNKTQAYLYEGELAAQRTKATQGRETFGVLGVDTDENPDFEVIEETQRQQGLGSMQVSSTRAIEVKASTSPNYASLDSLVGGGVKQLRKREQTGRFTHLTLMISNDNQHNHWPVTDHDFAATYGSNFNAISGANWNARLNTRMTALKNTNNIALPLHVEIQHGGTIYATCDV